MGNFAGLSRTIHPCGQFGYVSMSSLNSAPVSRSRSSSPARVVDVTNSELDTLVASMMAIKAWAMMNTAGNLREPAESERTALKGESLKFVPRRRLTSVPSVVRPKRQLHENSKVDRRWQLAGCAQG